MADLKRIAADLSDELDELDGLVSGLTEEQWKTSTPAKPWTVRDQIAHLAFFDDQAVLALMNSEAFATSLEQIAADVGAFMNRSVARARSLPGREVLGWWRESRTAVFDAIETLPADQRIPWYGPPMKPTSFLSARLMEAFAHGHDITDGLGTKRAPTDRLRHVAHIGFRARVRLHGQRVARTHRGGARGAGSSVGRDLDMERGCPRERHRARIRLLSGCHPAEACGGYGAGLLGSERRALDVDSTGIRGTARRRPIPRPVHLCGELTPLSEGNPP